MSCSICQHPKCQEIDQALITGSATLTALGQQYNLSTSALHRHKAHLQAKAASARSQLQDNLRQGCIFWLSQALEMAMQTARSAQSQGNSNLVLRALAQGTRLVSIILKQELSLDDRTIYEMLADPQWASQESLLPAANIMSLGRQSMASALASPCPETPSGGPASASPEELSLLHQLLSAMGPDSTPQTSAAPRKTAADNRLRPREKTGKLPGNKCYELDDEEQYRLVELEKKLSRLDLEAITRGLSPAAASAREEEILGQLWDSIPIPHDKPLSEYLYEQSLNGSQNDPHPGCGQGGPQAE